jgi:hypothetical protein
MKRAIDRRRKTGLFGFSSTQWKFVFISWGILMSLVAVGVIWLNAGAKGIGALQDRRLGFLNVIPEHWVFALLVAVLLFIPGYFLVKRH